MTFGTARMTFEPISYSKFSSSIKYLNFVLLDQVGDKVNIMVFFASKMTVHIMTRMI